MMANVGVLPEVNMANRAEVRRGCREVSARVFLCSQQLARGGHKMQGWGLILLGLKSCPLIRFWTGKELGMTLPLPSI